VPAPGPAGRHGPNEQFAASVKRISRRRDRTKPHGVNGAGTLLPTLRRRCATCQYTLQRHRGLGHGLTREQRDRTREGSCLTCVEAGVWKQPRTWDANQEVGQASAARAEQTAPLPCRASAHPRRACAWPMDGCKPSRPQDKSESAAPSGLPQKALGTACRYWLPHPIDPVLCLHTLLPLRRFPQLRFPQLCFPQTKTGGHPATTGCALR